MLPVQSPAELAWMSRLIDWPSELISPAYFTASRSFMSALAASAILVAD